MYQLIARVLLLLGLVASCTPAPAEILYKTPGAWGAGVGERKLTAAEVDNNFAEIASPLVGGQVKGVYYVSTSSSITDHGDAAVTGSIQNLINQAYNSDAGDSGTFRTIVLPPGRFPATQITMYNHIRLVGSGNGTGHSSVVTQYQTEIYQAAGTNSDLFVFSGDSVKFIHDMSIENMTLRGGWTGTGDAVTTSGSAIRFWDVTNSHGVTPGQNVRLKDLNIHDFPEDAIKFERNALPGMVENVWGRKIGGWVVNVETEEDPPGTSRISHLFWTRNIQGDYLGAGLIRVAGGNSANTYLFQDLKHEIDSGYSGYTVELNNMSGATVTVLNADAITSPSTVASNALIRLTGTTIPVLTVIGSYESQAAANPGTKYLIQDDVNTKTVAGTYRNAYYNAPIFYDGGSLAIRSANVGVTDGRISVTKTTDGPDGVVLTGVAAGEASPRLMFWNSTEGGTTGFSIYKGSAGLLFTTGANPGATSGTTRWTLLDNGNFLGPTLTLTGNLIYTPIATQTLAAGTALTATGKLLQIDCSGSVTSTATPFIANGSDGQTITIVNVGTGTLTIQDQGTLAGSNLRLTANTLAIAPRQSVELTYSSTVGDWVQTGSLVTVL